MEIQVVNVKCQGCANTVKKELEKNGIKDIEVSFTESDSVKWRIVKFDGDIEVVRKRLTELWYPEIGTKEAESFLKKARSFVSCVSGKIN